MVSVSMFTLSKFAVAPFVRAILPTKSRAPHLPILMGIVVLAVILLNVQGAHLGVWMWVLYALLLVLAVLRMGRTVAGLVVAYLNGVARRGPPGLARTSGRGASFRYGW